MNFLTLVNELGEDADLLARSDDWLEQERRAKAAELDQTANELRAILLAQRIKRALQQKNLVAVQQILKGADGEVRDIVIRIMNLPDAVTLLGATGADPLCEPVQKDMIDAMNVTAQMSAWHSDGYDLATSAALRS